MSEQPTVTVAGIDGLVSAIPYTLGFHPSESIVMALCQDGIVQAVGRADLTDAPDAVHLFAPFIAQVKPDRVFMLLYSADREQATREGRLLWRPISDLFDELELRNVSFGDPVVVGPDGWSYAMWADGEIHPLSNLGAAEAVFAGLTAAESREAQIGSAFERSYVEAFDEALLSDAPLARRHGQMLLAETLQSAMEDGVGPETAAQLLSLARVPALRDGFWFSLTRDNAQRMFSVWIDVYHRAPRLDLAELALALAAICAWQTGTGALFTEALERLDAIHADGPVAQIAQQIHRLALAPSELDTLVDAMQADVEDDE